MQDLLNRAVEIKIWKFILLFSFENFILKWSGFVLYSLDIPRMLLSVL
jgi:hypothetical protein